MQTSENSKRIAKNTMLLYVRMIFQMAVTLYTSRVVLNVLGITDFGIYNVVGGVVTMLGFISGSLGGATSRFITFELGRGDADKLKMIFRCALTVHYLLAIGLFVLAETVGLWFVLEKMVIPAERMEAVFWVYQCSILTFVVSIISIPYNALIIAHERMDAFAYISIFETCSKLAVAVLLTWTSLDRLILYAVLLLTVHVIARIIYTMYCNKHFAESSARWLWNKEFSKKIAVYAGWTLNGDLALVGITQGTNILLNLFFGPAVNAARGVAVQVQSAVTQFFGNFQMAVRPQVTKSYAQGNLDYMHQLIINSSKYSFYLIVLVALPLLVNTDYILSLWLGEVPEHTISFTRIMILTCVCSAFSQPIIMAIHATGDIKKFQLIEGSMLLTVVPINYVLLKFAHISSEMVFIVYLLIEVVTQVARILIVCPRISMSKKVYLKGVVYPIIKMSVPLIMAGFFIFYTYKSVSFISLIGNAFLCLVIVVSLIYGLGLNSEEREFVVDKLKLLSKKFRK